MITFQAGRHEREREGEGEHRLVQAHGRHSHPSATLREADTAFLAQKRKGTLAPWLVWSLPCGSGPWGASPPFAKHAQCSRSSDFECEQVHTKHSGRAQWFSGATRPTMCCNWLNITLKLILSYFLVNPVFKPPLSQAAVRDACSGTLVEIYRHVGERVRKEFCANQCREICLP